MKSIVDLTDSFFNNLLELVALFSVISGFFALFSLEVVSDSNFAAGGGDFGRELAELLLLFLLLLSLLFNWGTSIVPKSNASPSRSFALSSLSLSSTSSSSSSSSLLNSSKRSSGAFVVLEVVEEAVVAVVVGGGVCEFSGKVFLSRGLQTNQWSKKPSNQTISNAACLFFSGRDCSSSMISSATGSSFVFLLFQGGDTGLSSLLLLYAVEVVMLNLWLLLLLLLTLNE